MAPHRRRRLLALVLLFVVAAAVVFVLTRGEDEPPEVSGNSAQAVGTVVEFERAVAARDFETVCDRLYTTEARQAAGGDDCQSVLTQAAARFGTPKITIRSVRLRGDEATVTVTAAAPGRRASTDTIELAREGDRYRIVSAGRPPDER